MDNSTIFPLFQFVCCSAALCPLAVGYRYISNRSRFTHPPMLFPYLTLIAARLALLLQNTLNLFEAHGVKQL